MILVVKLRGCENSIYHRREDTIVQIMQDGKPLVARVMQAILYRAEAFLNHLSYPSLA